MIDDRGRIATFLGSFTSPTTVWHVLRSLTSLQPYLHWKWKQQWDLLVVQTRSCRTTRNLYRDSLSCKTAHAVWPKTSLMSPFWRIEGALFFRHWCDSVYAIKLRVNCLLLCVSYVPCIVACNDAWLSLSLSLNLFSLRYVFLVLNAVFGFVTG